MAPNEYKENIEAELGDGTGVVNFADVLVLLSTMVDAELIYLVV